MEGRDAHQHSACRKPIRRADRERVGAEHQHQHADQPADPEVEPGAAERPSQPGRNRPHRLRQQVVGAGGRADTTKPVSSTPASPSCPSRTREDEPRVNAPRRSSARVLKSNAPLWGVAPSGLLTLMFSGCPAAGRMRFGRHCDYVRYAELGRVMGLRLRPFGPLRARQRRARCVVGEVRATSPRPRCALTFCSIRRSDRETRSVPLEP